MKAIVVTMVISFLLISGTFAQGREWQNTYEDANIYYEIGDYYSALQMYNKLYVEDSSHKELTYRIGICHFNLRQKMASFPFFQKALKNNNKEAYYYIGQVYHLMEEFDKEIESYQLYQNSVKLDSDQLKTVNRFIESAKYAKQLKERPVNADIINAGENVNTKYHEYAPLVYGAQDEMYFTSRREGTTGGNLDPYGNYFEDIYVSKKNHGNWGKPIQLGPNINTPTNDGSVGISPDGQVLYIFRTGDNLVTGDLYESNIEASGWGAPKKLPSQINSEFVETCASISNNEQVLYFSSDREGGFGGKDIYRVVKLPTGDWSLPQNLGPTINTEYDEDSPFIHVDDKTLYFSSNGHKTMGGFDIFESQLGENGLWTQPLNMGYPVNTVAHDLYFVMSPDKQKGYYSSAQPGGFGGQDIYIIDFKLFAEVLTVVKGGVFSESGSGIPVDAKVTLIDSKTRNIQGIYKTNEKSGKFIMVISPEIEYTMMVEADGYHTYSRQIAFTAANLFSSKISEINLIPKKQVAEVNE